MTIGMSCKLKLQKRDGRDNWIQYIAYVTDKLYLSGYLRPRTEQACEQYGNC